MLFIAEITADERYLLLQQRSVISNAIETPLRDTAQRVLLRRGSACARAFHCRATLAHFHTVE
ncbi:hypothetical protein [Paraburkholderia rhizosphaerae]|uniref:hypothetical protein n=1 Tax=Paraburkholderia rhizosphaerae TaxID=480658 RepID=UPI0010664C62|nr:hypothetical protein [Paraburkholderia rhizosphaerae]